MKVVQFVAESLGDASYLVIDGPVAAAIDPQRDIRPFLRAAEEHGAAIQYVFETHVHNDYLSGGRELAERGAQVVVPAKSGIAFPHVELADGGAIEVGGARIGAVAAPGHTYEHTAYLLRDAGGAATAAFTGGSLLMAAAGRSDLLGPADTEELTRLQWETAHRLAALLPPAAQVYPTHGAGSFCSSTGIGGDRCGPLATELGRNPALASDSFETFRRLHLAERAPIPGYYQYMAPINRSGPKVYGEPPRPARLSPGDTAGLLRDGVHVLDVRSRKDFAAGFIPGSLDVEESNSLLAYVGWLVPFNAPVALIAYDAAQAERVTADLFRIGYEDVRGYLAFADWGRGTEQLPVVGVQQAVSLWRSGDMATVDVRFAYEQESRPLPGALQRPVDQLPEWEATVPAGPMLVVCASGQRATMAASVLRRAGHEAIALAEGGAEDLLGA